MDACDEGLCILYPSAREYVRLHFDVVELQAIKSPLSAESVRFSINVRDAFSAVLAVLVWGPRWPSHVRANTQPVYIRCWIDNKSAVAWLGNQQSRNPSGQELSRVLACAELQFGLHVSTEHLRGSSNFLVDLESRAWTGHMLETWTNHVRSWYSQNIPPGFRKIDKPKLSTCNGTHYRTPPANATSTRGTSGANSATGEESHAGYRPTTRINNPYSSLLSRLKVGTNQTMWPRPASRPYGLRSAVFDGIIKRASVSDLTSSPNTSRSYEKSVGSANPDTNVPPSPSPCSKLSRRQQISPSLSTASIVGLRCWASSSF